MSAVVDYFNIQVFATQYLYLMRFDNVQKLVVVAQLTL